MADLTEEQTITVQEKSQSIDKPSYYSSAERKNTIIGDDLEAFLILSDPDLKEEIIDRLGVSNEGDPDRQDLYKEALSFETVDASTRLVDLERGVAGFGAFRLRVMESPAGSTTDVAPLVQDIQRGLGAVSEQRERTYHEFQVSKVLTSINNRLEGSSDEVLQRESWEGVISAYRG